MSSQYSSIVDVSSAKPLLMTALPYTPHAEAAHALVPQQQHQVTYS